MYNKKFLCTLGGAQESLHVSGVMSATSSGPSGLPGAPTNMTHKLTAYDLYNVWGKYEVGMRKS